MKNKSISIIATGGTIAKTYSQDTIINQSLVIDKIINKLTLPNLKIKYNDLMRIDSLKMTNKHRQKIFTESCQALKKNNGIIITHGTDTMVETGIYLQNKFFQNTSNKNFTKLSQPIILTGAMLPYSMKGSDAEQNIIEALLAVQLLPPEIYIVFHNKVLILPNVKKDYKLKTFVVSHKN